MTIKKKSKTNQVWEGRQAALELKAGRWEVSFLASTQGSITNLGGQVAEFKTPKADEASSVMFAWITSGIVPAFSETHAPDWFTAIA